MSTVLRPCFKCGMPLNFSASPTIVCRACGRINARPESTGECLEYLDRATRLRLDQEYQAAEEAYTFVLHQHPKEYEALWGRVLSHYGVEFRQDEENPLKRHILVHFPRIRPFSEQSDYRAACKVAPPEVRDQYRQDAQFIDEVQRKTKVLAQQGRDYDIFLCFKNTIPGTHQRTDDYYLADSLYERWRDQYRVFFAPETLPTEAAGANYEATIYHALETSPLMIVVGSRPEYMTAPWPQSEWSRFLEWYDGMHGEGVQKRLIPVYRNMTRAELPSAFRNRSFQDFDLSDPHAMDNLNIAVRKCFDQLRPDPEPATEQMKLLFQQWLTSQLQAGQIVPPPAQPVQPKAPVPRRQTPLSAFDYQTRPDGICILKYEGTLDEIIIPDGVVEIGKEAFPNAWMLQKLTLPDSLRTIGDAAFSGAEQLESVILPEGLKAIGDFAFDGCSCLASISFPDGLEEIGHWAFHHCALASITLPASLRAIGDAAFADCPLAKIALAPHNQHFQLSDGILINKATHRALCCAVTQLRLQLNVPDGVKHIGTACFANAEMTKVVLPAGVLTIGTHAFDHCIDLEQIELPDTLVALHACAFLSCVALRKVMLPGSLTQIDSDAFSNCPNLTIHAPAGSFAEKYAKEHSLPLAQPKAPRPAQAARPSKADLLRDFKWESSYGGITITKYIGKSEHVTIPDGVVTIGIDAFENCTFLKSVTCPQGVRSIDVNAFSCCTSLTTVHLDSGLEEICIGAFDRCRSLTSIDLPEGCRKLGYKAFSNTGLTSIHLPSTLEVCNRAAFTGTPLKKITVSSARQRLTMNDQFLINLQTKTLLCDFSSRDEVRVPQGIQHIGESAFCLHPMTKIDLPSGLRTIAFYAFCDCKALTSVTLPEGVTTLGDFAFDGCNNLATVQLPNTLTSIGLENPFRSCKPLVIYAPADSFAAKYAKERKLPLAMPKAPAPAKSVRRSRPTATPLSAFEYEKVTGGLRITKYKGQQDTVVVPDEVVEIGEKAFQDSQIRKIDLPDALHTIGPRAFWGCEQLTSVEMGSGLKTIGISAFYGCTALTSLTLPESCTTIEDAAFEKSGLTSITLPASVETIDENVFLDAPLQSITVHPQNQHFKVENGLLIDTEKRSIICCPSVRTSVTIPSGVSSICSWAFAHTKIQQVAIPEGVYSIGHSAFSFCDNLTSVSLPRSLVQLEGNVFSSRPLQRITIDPKNQHFKVVNELLIDIDKNTVVCCPPALTSVTIPSTVTRIGDSAFSDTKATHLVIPEGVTFIGGSAFNSRNLTDLTLPASLQGVSSMTFFGCYGVTIHAPSGSFAEKVAKDNNYKFVSTTKSSTTKTKSSGFSLWPFGRK